MSNPRVISGIARGQRLQDVPGKSTRPITDRVKEALFNIIGSDIANSSFLDLFGGTGSVGIEALSRGARFAQFVEINRNAITTINANLATTNLSSSSEVFFGDVFTFLRNPVDRKFDYVFIAPPQYKALWTKALKELNDNPDWISKDSWIIVQIDPKEYCSNYDLRIIEFDKRVYGNTMLVFFSLPEDDQPNSTTNLPFSS